ncbi:fatty-acyl-CoA synthase [Streptomyces sp. 2224.1]|uniref:AMP-binding protein n=1 Tax=unclassified Streptomyces TaxID=2593676 RepID=UPI00088A0516|nr:MULTISPECIES: AMP-binding protein [unclassified Streptomyces]PBC82023.1 fatty-acyl-CoA synthase [Streptomyces sp. 2321.6]SDR51882.1 fatty-acyl-CoA synthase [Streptomyces sp. KS_16]SEC40390.1 fatty-acyl-CoA synthase [Streptomyces sp. 2133.1]SEC63171.1 fatty-acyl-CoA synthase [Streptomyces sp. 2224.1]SNC67212.1 fatty-acyl-CoA synthase [Streptomyces sp. 2114.4]
MTPATGFTSYADALLAALARDPSRTAVTVGEDGEEITAGALHATVHRMAAVLAAHGTGPGQTVCLLSGNRPEALAARYAASLLGARVVFLYDGMAAETLARIAAGVDTTLLLVDPALHDTARTLLHHLRGPVPEVMTLGEDTTAPDTAGPGADPGTGPVPDLLAAAAALPATPEVPSAARPEEDWCIRHTGGTTGIPKGVRMRHAPYARMVIQQRMETAGDPPRFLACTPLAHLAGILADAALVAGGTVVLHRAFDPTAVLAAVARHRITHLWLLPPLLYRLLDDPTLRTTDLSSLTRISYGGCAASPTRLAQAAEAFGPVLFGMYGQAEAMSITEARPEDHLRTGPGGRITVGRALPGVTLAVRDADGRDLPAGERGEVHVRSAAVMNGYWKQPDETAQVLGADGWLRTGDVGVLDEEGRLYLVDRVKDLIIVVGGHVHPAEIEDLLHTHPAIAHCAVYGVRGADEAEEVHAAVVPAPGHRVDADALRAFVTEHKGTLYAPAAVRVLDTLPLTPVGKPDKALLRATAATAATA